MNNRTISIEEVKQTIGGYKYGLVYENSEMLFGRTKELRDVDWEQLQEAFFFDRKSQVHIFRDGDNLKSVVVEDEAEDVYQLRNYRLNQNDKRASAAGKELVVKEYLEQDEDGQVYIKCTRMIDVK